MVGNLCDDKWIGSLIRNLKKTSNIEIDFYHIITTDRSLSDASKLCNNVFRVKRHFPSFLYKIPKFCFLSSFIDVPLSLKSFLENLRDENFYDVINIHYPENKVLCRWKDFASVSKKTIITPWGSEVLRISTLSQKIMSRFMAHFDYVMSSDNPRFKQQIQDILHVSDEKFLSCDFGSEMIDELCSSIMSKNEAKKHFGIEDQFTIVCGYNGVRAQNHLKIIDSILKVKEQLPEDIFIVLPMTYNATNVYLNEVQQRLTDNNLQHLILKEYMSNSDMICLRKCADMFIHAQNTDANSVSLAEHLLCDNIVINASWLRYENREKYGIPYYLFDSFEELPNVILKGFRGGSIVPKKLIESISEEGWQEVSKKWINIYEMN